MNPANAQPFLCSTTAVRISVAHNGNRVDAAQIRSDLEGDGAIFQTTTDTEVLLHLIARSRVPDVADAIVDACRQVRGAFSLIFLVPGRLVAVRDPMGFRPLSLGRVDGAWVVASESCAFDLLGAEKVRDLERGEVVVIDVAGVHSKKPFAPAQPAPCAFEHVYFSRPDSTIFGQSVQAVRKRLGAELFKEQPADVDLIVPVPDSGTFAGLGYASASKIPFELGLVRNHYVGRTFIEPSQQIRNFGVRVKLNPVRETLAGRRIALIDDSLVRGTTSQKIVQMCRDAGAKEVHLRISCPPTIGPCYYGIDTPRREELIAASKTIEQTRRFVGADSLGYLSLAGMMKAIGGDADSYCTACWTDRHPVPLPIEAEGQRKLFEKARR